MFNKKTIKDVKIAGQTILLRTDYNVPLGEPSTDATGEAPSVLSDLRIRASLPTIQYLLEHKAKKIIIISHLGRPEGRDAALSLKPVAEALAGLLPGHTVEFVDDVSGPEVESAVEALPNGGILLLENLRFSPLEEKNSEDYAREIVDSVHPDLFVQDGFAVVHRAHASTDAITQLIPSVAGLLLEEEITKLSRVLSNPARPLTLILGGAKVSDKEPLIAKFSDFADHICIGGKIAADMQGDTEGKNEEENEGKNDGFSRCISDLAASRPIFQTAPTGSSRRDGSAGGPAYEVENSQVAERKAQHSSRVDIAAEVSAQDNSAYEVENARVVQEGVIDVANDFDEDNAGAKLDIGPLSTARFVETIKGSQTVIWNGLTGKAEDPAFATSSTIIAKTLGEDDKIFSVICGGDTTGFVEELSIEFPELHYDLVSTGGGAALEYLCGKPLPGYEALEDR